MDIPKIGLNRPVLDQKNIPHAHHLPKALIGTAALIALLGGYALTRGGESNSQVIDNNPISDSLKPPESPKPPEIPVVAPLPTEQPQPDKDKITPPKPEIQPFDCGILSPESCAKGVHIEWNSPAGNRFRGIGFILNKGDTIKTPKKLEISRATIKQPDVYQGVQVIGKTMDNSETYQYYGNITLGEIESLPNGTMIIGEIDKGDLTVFEGHPFNLVFKGPVNYMKIFESIQNDPPKIVNNKVPGNPAANPANFYDVPPRKSK
ncbi:hypothetical protein HYT18_05325 [Candidatus Microgenomates bacterium]|nr:hypothetical protein [Candidatus Microgenomates bacterium]